MSKNTNDFDEMDEDDLLQDDLEEYNHDELFDDNFEEDLDFESGVAASEEEDTRARMDLLKQNRKNKAADRRGRKTKLSRKQRKKRKLVLLCIASAFVLGIAIGAISLINKYTPTKERMSAFDYFHSVHTNEVLIVLDNETEETKGLISEGRIYLPCDFTADNLNQRFYYDKESQGILYADGTEIYSFQPDSKTYTDSKGNSFSEEYDIVKDIDGVLCIDIEFLNKYTNFTYVSFESPNRVIISTQFEEVPYVTVSKDTAVRYRGGIKSPILEDVKQGEKLYFSANLDGWTEVRTESGFLGYVKEDCVGEMYTESRENHYADNISSISKKSKISMSWFQVTNITANTTIDSYLSGTQGITTISPTWYSINSNAGDMSSLATKAFVDNMHSRGIEVWPLVDDFDTGLNGTDLYSSKSARTKMINTLITDSLKYGYDGINIDFEKITKESAEHYLEFIRELSVSCRRNNIVLSIDNYKSASSLTSFYDLKEQGAYADYIVIMGYDEHYAGSESGSVASIGYVKEGIADALEVVSNQKLINAIPFYTRIWTITGGQSQTSTTSKAVGMQAAIDDLNNNGAIAIWDDSTGQYFGSYDSANGVVKIWLEEDHSIEEKMKVIQQYNLAGVAQWKLGLEKKSVWSVIAKYNQ